MTMQESEFRMEKAEDAVKIKKETVLKTGISGFDELFMDGGIPSGSSVLVAGGPGTGKSILCRNICYNAVSKGKKEIFFH